MKISCLKLLYITLAPEASKIGNISDCQDKCFYYHTGECKIAVFKASVDFFLQFFVTCFFIPFQFQSDEKMDLPGRYNFDCACS